MELYLLIACVILSAAAAVLAALSLKRASREREGEEALRAELAQLRAMQEERERALRRELADATQRTVGSMGEMLLQNQQRMGASLERNLAARQETMNKAVQDMHKTLETRFGTFATENEQKLENIRNTVETRLGAMQADNNRKLDEMRGIVDEKLQKTLEERMTQSFRLVNERLEQVYKGLGEMQTLAAGVGDLSRVLSNVKTRGILGEIQLGAILEEIMAPEQYLRNVVTAKNSRNPVEYAIKLPAEDGGSVLLPIDSKFPMDAYTALCDAYESGNPEAVRTAQNELRARVRGFAKDIRDKYIAPPETTEFAVMFLPTEGLYAEVVKLGMIETLQRDFRVNVAGPSTMAALLNSLQMGFRSVAIQKRSGEVWKVLGAVKTEFEKFNDVLVKTQEKLTRAHDDLDKLIGVRTRGIRRSLREVTALPQQDAAALLPTLGTDDPPEDSPYGEGE
ncbi:MAG: DNA recombination protein RmuC [Clostridium sp.]|nr:DNA recombination protein RmuC [Clostridium sp.]